MSKDVAKQRIRQHLAERDGEVCQFCGAIGTIDPTRGEQNGVHIDNGALPLLTLDRIEPGGPYTIENCQLLCGRCNASKGNDPATKIVRFADTLWQQGFVQVPNAILRDSRVSAHAKLVLAALMSYAHESDEAWPGQTRLAKELGLSESSVRRAVRELEGHGLLRTRHRDQGRTNTYVLLVQQWRRRSQGPASDTERSEGPARPVRGTGGERSEGPGKKNHKQDTEEQEPPPTSPTQLPVEAAAAPLNGSMNLVRERLHQVARARKATLPPDEAILRATRAAPPPPHGYEVEVEAFASYYLDGKGRTKRRKDIAGCWRMWLRNAARFAQSSGNGNGRSRGMSFEQMLSHADRFEREEGSA